MTSIRAAHLRYAYSISKRQWDREKYTEKEILEWWVEFILVKTHLGEIKKPEDGRE